MAHARLGESNKAVDDLYSLDNPQSIVPLYEEKGSWLMQL